MTTSSLSLADEAYERLRGEILHGDLMPGERLRGADLRARFGLGLTPAREALARLASEGLVTAQPHCGARVVDVSPEALRDLMATRRRIERACLEDAVGRGDAAWEGEILAALHVLSKTPLPTGRADREGALRWEAAHRRFHHALVAACGSPWLLRFWAELVDHSERYRKLRLLPSTSGAVVVRQGDVAAEHAALANAALARNTAALADLMDAHLGATERAVVDQLQALDGPPVEGSSRRSAAKGVGDHVPARRAARPSRTRASGRPDGGP